MLPILQSDVVVNHVTDNDDDSNNKNKNNRESRIGRTEVAAHITQ